MVMVTEVVEPVLVFQPFLVSRVDLPGLAASKHQAPSKQATSSKQASSTREMGKNQNSVVVVRIRPKFWWMIPMGVKYNHTKYEQETQRWRPGTGFATRGGGGRARSLYATPPSPPPPPPGFER